VQELRQWQREWREENRAQTLSFVGDFDRRTSAPDDDKTTPPPADTQNNVDDSSAELAAGQAEDSGGEDKLADDGKDTQRAADDITSPTADNTRPLDSTCCC